MSKKYKTVSVSVEEAAAPVAGQVLPSRISHYYEFNGEIRQHQEVDFPAGQVQQQQLIAGNAGAWVNVGAPLSNSAPTTFGFDLPLNANTGVQYVYVG